MRSQYPIGNIAFYRHDINRMDMYLLICNLCIHSVCQYSINFNIGQEYIPCNLCNAPPPLLENIWLFDIAYSFAVINIPSKASNFDTDRVAFTRHLHVCYE